MVAAFAVVADIKDGEAEGESVAVAEVLPESFVLVGGQFLVGIEHEDPVTAGVFEGGVAGGGEVVGPGDGIDFSAVGASDVEGAVGGACIDDDDLVGDGGYGLEAGAKEAFFVFCDEADGEAG